MLYTRYYADNYEEVHEDNNVYRYYYVYTPDGLSAVAEKKNTTMNIYSSETDYLGSIVSLYNTKGKMAFRAEYDAWGRQNVVVDSLARFQRGYCGHEHWHEFDLVDMNGRMYDPVIARFLSPDPFVQAPEDLQNYNRYSYCLNNPLKYSDPSGEFVVSLTAATIGFSALVGAYSGYKIAESKGYDLKDIQTYGYMLVGGAYGGIAAYAGSVLGASVASSVLTSGGSAFSSSLTASIVEGVTTKGISNLGTSILKGDNLGQIFNNTVHGMIEGAFSGLAGGFSYQKTYDLLNFDFARSPKTEFKALKFLPENLFCYMASSTASQMSSNVSNRRKLFEGVDYGLNLGAIVPLGIEMSRYSGSIGTKILKKNCLDFDILGTYGAQTELMLNGDLNVNPNALYQDYYPDNFIIKELSNMPVPRSFRDYEAQWYIKNYKWNIYSLIQTLSH